MYLVSHNIFPKYYFCYVFAVRAITALNNSAIAFTAAGPMNVQSSKDRALKFEVVRTNIGNAYNRDTGIFTSPVSGTYVFYTQAFGTNTPELSLEILKNDLSTRVAMAYEDMRAPGFMPAHISSSDIGTVHLQAGDRVYVRVKLGFVEYNASTFSGFLLQRD
jgi:hypothetical protein